VTHVDGRQTIEEITDDLGIAADDQSQMIRNLKKRGIHAKSVQAYGAASSMSKKKRKGAAPKFSRSKQEKLAKARQDRSTIKPPPFATSQAPKSFGRNSNSRNSSRSSSRQSSNNSTNSQSQNNNPSLKPFPSVRELAPIVSRCRQDIVERAKGSTNEYRDTLMDRYDRMQYHLTELDEKLAEIMLDRSISRRGVDRRTRTLSCDEFGHVLCAFTFEGQDPMEENDIVVLWRGCEGGNVDILTRKIFRPNRIEQTAAASLEQVTESTFVDGPTLGQEEVGLGPFDHGHYGERVVPERDLKHWPKRMRYRYSNTPVQAPTDFDGALVQRSAQLPNDAELELEWVYGNNGKCYDNVHVSARGELVYHKAAVVVLHDVDKGTQRHFMYHDDDVTCLDVDASGTLGASGQMGKEPRICVFDLMTFDVLAVVGGKGFFERSVCAVSFCSVDSGYLMGVGDDDHHALGVWKWKLNKTELEGLTMHGLMSSGQPSPGKLIGDAATMNGEPPQIYNLIVPDRDAQESNATGTKIQRFSTVGNSHTKFWEVDLSGSVASGRSPISCRNSRYNNGVGGRRTQPRKTMCAAYCPDGITVITGGSDGTCYIWNTRKGECIQTFRHHPEGNKKSKVDIRRKSTCVQAISILPSSSNSTFTVITGGMDGTVRRYVLSPASRGKACYDIRGGQSNSLVCDLSKEYRGRRERVRASNMDEPDTIIAPRPSESKLSFKSHGGRGEDKGRGDPSRGDGTLKGTEGVPSGNPTGGKAERAKKRAEADAGLLGGPSVLRARHAVTALETINGICYVSTRRGDVWTIDPTSSKVTQRVHSHFGPVYGCCSHPSIPNRFATAGEDRLLCIWDGHKQICSQYLPTLARSISYSPDGNHIAIGCVNGAVLIYRFLKERPRANVFASLVFYKVVQDCVEAVDDLKYSPDGKMLAVGSHDNFVDVYYVHKKQQVSGRKSKHTDTDDAYVHASRCRGHTSYITHIDWSVDSRVIQSNCGAYEIIYWDAESGKPILSSTDTVEADTDWATWTCVLGFPVMGVWPEFTDGTDVNSVHRSSDGKHIVTGDDFGNVKLFNAPCVVHHAPSKTYGGHSSHVMNIRWLLGDKNVVSVGGWDEGVFLWKVNRSSGGNGGRGRTSKWQPLTNFR
tara:strand:- start:388 stop:3804 length:3417 start_codon:yes stop_codon:yes gene_type:complete